MHKILGNKAPTKKVSANIKYKEQEVRYVATPTRENMVIRKGNEVVGGIYVTVKLIKGLNVRNENIEVFGEWKDFEWLVTKIDQPKDAFILFDNSPKGSSNRVKGFEYDKLEDVGAIQEMSFGEGKRVEDFLYEPVTIKDLEEENNLDWAKEKDYHILTRTDEIQDFISDMSKEKDIVGFDTETTGLLANRTKLDKLVGMSFSYKDHTGVYLPILHERFDNIEMGGNKLIELLRPYLDSHSDIALPLVTHNGGFDWKVLKMFGIELNIEYDTFIRQSLSNITTAKNMGKLKEIVKAVFGYDTVELEDMYKPRTKAEIKQIAKAVASGSIPINDITRRKLETAEEQKDLLDFRFADKEFVRLYGSADADFPRILHKKMDEEWDDSLNYVYNLELETIPVLGEQEYYGVMGRREGFEELHADATIRLDKLKEQIYEEAGEVFNINSSPQKVNILFNKLGCPQKSRYKTKKGNWSTGNAVLEDLEKYKDSKGNQRYPIASYLMEYATVNKLISGFYGKIPKMLVENVLFAQYRQLGTQTGRVSNHSPNLQQTEPTSRKHMIPDSDEFYFLICDYSQVEYRIMAGLAGEKKVVDFFTYDAEADYHIMAYSNMMKIPYEDVTSEERKAGKVLNFGTSYGLEDQSLAMNLYGDDSKFSQVKANQARKDYFDGVPFIRDYFAEKQDFAEAKGYALTMFNRRRDILEFSKDKKYVSEYSRGSGRRKGANHSVQGTAADILKMAMARIRKFFRREGYYEDMVRLVMNIHDEVVIQIHKSINPYYATLIVRRAMEMDFSKYGFPPLYIGAIVGDSWHDGQIDEREAPVYLLDEKCAEVEQALKEGKELPVYDDPRAVWKENIDKYALRVIKEELEKGYKDKDSGEQKEIIEYTDTIKNGRLSNYAYHFGSIAHALILEVIENEPLEVYNNISNVEDYQTERSKLALERIKEVIEDNEVTTLAEAVAYDVVVDESFYFGDHCWTVVDLLINDGVDTVYSRLSDLIREEGYEPIKYDRPVKKEGKDITKEFETVEMYVKKKKIRYNKKLNRIRVYVDNDDVELFKIIDTMLVSVVGLNNFKSDEVSYNFGLVFENGKEYYARSYKLFKKFLPILKKAMENHVKGIGYSGMEKQVLKIGESLLTEASQKGTQDKENMKALDKDYQTRQTSEGQKKMETLRVLKSQSK